MSYKRIKKFREERKRIIVQALGGCCIICGYNKCLEALDIHHIDPSTKEFSLSRSIMSWERTYLEIQKCTLLCANCHREVHNGFQKLPNKPKEIDRKYKDYYKVADRFCPVCNERMNHKCSNQKTCSIECSKKIHSGYKVAWKDINLRELLKTKTISQISDDLNISWNAVKKQVKKL